nr:MAG TPA: hypothetical protein [Caudoviricetes sp.]
MRFNQSKKFDIFISNVFDMVAYNCLYYITIERNHNYNNYIVHNIITCVYVIYDSL